MPRGRSISSCFDCAEPTNPTGPPSTAAGVGAPSSTSSSSRNNAVGALPIASTAPPSRSAHRSTAAADRVVPVRSARSAALVSATSGHHLVVGGQPGLRDSRGHHRRIAQHRRAGDQRGVGLGDDVIAEGDVFGDVDLPAGVDQPHHHPRDVVRGTATGPPRRGSSRTTADRSRRRRGCSRAPAHPTGAAHAAGIRLRSPPAPHRRVGCRTPVRSRRSAGAHRRARRAPLWHPRERRRPNARSRGCPYTR